MKTSRRSLFATIAAAATACLARISTAGSVSRETKISVEVQLADGTKASIFHLEALITDARPRRMKDGCLWRTKMATGDLLGFDLDGSAYFRPAHLPTEMSVLQGWERI